MGSSSKGTSISNPTMGSYGAAPALGVDPQAQADYQKKLADYQKKLAAYDAQVASIRKLPSFGGIRKNAMNHLGAATAAPVAPVAPDAPVGIGSADLMKQTTMGVSNPYGTSRVVQNPDGSYTTQNEMSGGVADMFNKAFAPDSGKQYSDALYSQAMGMIQPDMAARGLPMGSEINDTSRANAAMQSILGGNQMRGQDIGLAMSAADRASGARGPDVLGSHGLDFQARTLPYMNEVNKQNLIYGNQAANNRQSAANKSSNKNAAMGAVGNVGGAAVGKGA